MMIHEFENLTIRGNGEIGVELYAAIERFYTSENDYHAVYGGVNESKYDFCKRVFGGKVNTPKTIAQKIAAESMKENRFLLAGCGKSENELKAMDEKILEHYMTLYKYGL